jgi:TetR/AcrR family transcriptional regulator, transcriptional repressor for nem operon
MRYGPEHKQKTRERVLAAAARAIRAEGPHRVGVAGVMSKAGLTHGGFYAHFASKDALIAAAIEQMFEAARARWARETRDRSPAEGLAAYLDFYLSPAHRDARGTGCPMPALAGDLPRLTGASRAAFGAGTRALVGLLAGHLAALGHEDPEVLASSVLAELVGALSLARGEPDRERSDALLAASRRMVRERVGLR